MKEPRPSNAWNIAATHFLTAGFAIPFAVSIVFGLVFGATLEKGTLLYSITGIAVDLAAMWLGVKYSARYLRRHYIFSDARRIIKIATVYFVVFYGLYDLVQMGLAVFAAAEQGITQDMETLPLGFAIMIIDSILIGVVFYNTSKKTLISEPTGAMPTPTQQLR